MNEQVRAMAYPQSPMRRILHGGFIVAFIFLAMISLAHATENTNKKNESTSTDRAAIGDTTRGLLQAQVDGSIAGPALPMLGTTSSLSWQRYLDSYKHPIPETFTRRIDEAASSR